jgi:hypothetical protein
MVAVARPVHGLLQVLGLPGLDVNADVLWKHPTNRSAF